MKNLAIKTCIVYLIFSVVVATEASSQVLSTDKPSYDLGESITVNFTGARTRKDWIAFYPQNITPGPGNSICWLYTSNTQFFAFVHIVNGAVVFPTGIVTPGNYKAVLLANNGYTVTAEVNFVVAAVPAAPVADFSASSTTVANNDSLTFTDQSTGRPSSWSWSFPGGIPATSHAKFPVVKYTQNGSYPVTLTVSNASGTSSATKTSYITVSNPSEAINLKVMSFNVFHEGTAVINGMAYIKDVVNSTDPDIVCFSEVRNYSGDWTTRIVNDLAAEGKKYYNGFLPGCDVSIISKYPITATGPLLAGVISVFTIDVEGTEVVVCPAHLDYTFYATYLPRGYSCGGSGKYKGFDPLNPFAPVTDLATIEDQNLRSQRDEAIAAFITLMQTESRPLILAGDFNEPSCLDWTSRQAGLYDHNGVIFQWNTTLSLKNNGFKDAYREVYPDEVLNPGISWPAVATGIGSTSWTPWSDERDRIDYIFYKGTGMSATDAAMVGPKATYATNTLTTAGNGADIFKASALYWPSDHKAVLATIAIPRTSTIVSKGASNMPVRNITTIDSKDESGFVKAYPNPSGGVITVVPKNILSEALIIVTDVTGKKMLTTGSKARTNNQTLLDITGFPDGIYFIHFIAKEKSETIKIVKKTN